MMEMTNFEIGNVTVEYDRRGNAMKASFTPTKVEFLEVLSQLQNIRPTNDVEYLANNVELVFASYFSLINDVELRDFEIQDIEKEVVTCEKWEDGLVKLCEIKFIFRDKNNDYSSFKVGNKSFLTLQEARKEWRSLSTYKQHCHSIMGFHIKKAIWENLSKRN